MYGARSSDLIVYIAPVNYMSSCVQLSISFEIFLNLLSVQSMQDLNQWEKIVCMSPEKDLGQWEKPLCKCAEQYHSQWGKTLHVLQGKILTKERRRYISSVFSHWLSFCWVQYKTYYKMSQVCLGTVCCREVGSPLACCPLHLVPEETDPPRSPQGHRDPWSLTAVSHIVQTASGGLWMSDGSSYIRDTAVLTTKPHICYPVVLDFLDIKWILKS